MLRLSVPGLETFNDETQTFDEVGGFEVSIEHSLLSMSKWESKWEVPFLGANEKTTEQVFDYIEMMVVDQKVPEDFTKRLTSKQVEEINDYIAAKMTATWFAERPEGKGVPSKEVITSEIVYYWMVSLQIPFVCETWHLNRLITLIKVINEKNAAANDTKKRPMTRSALDARRALNEQRRQQAATSG